MVVSGHWAEPYAEKELLSSFHFGFAMLDVLVSD